MILSSPVQKGYMTTNAMYAEMEGKTVFFKNGYAHPTIVDDVGNSTPVSIVIADGYAKYNGTPLRLTRNAWIDIYQTFKENN